MPLERPNEAGEGKRERLDPQDVGAEYRNMIGIPGGMESPLYKEVKAANKYNMPLKSGTGGPPGSDTEGEYVDHTAPSVTYKDFINKELVLYAKYDLHRMIPSIVDGLKPSQRKVLFSCIKRKLTKDVKVAQLSGYVSPERRWDFRKKKSCFFSAL